MLSINEAIAGKLAISAKQVNAVIDLLDEGSTVPFIARYRKEVTGGLDDAQLRDLHEQLLYMRDLNARRETILKSIEEQEKLTPELKKAILAAETKTVLEDLYLPYKPKRRTKAQIAKEAGLEPLATRLLENPELDPQTLAKEYLNPEHQITDEKAALDGARQILMEQFAENAELTGYLREFLWQNAVITATVVKDKEAEAQKFRDYFAYSEAVNKIPSHRALALFRGRTEGFLHIKISLDDYPDGHTQCEAKIAKAFAITHNSRAADDWLAETVRYTWKIKLLTRLELDLMTSIREAAEAEAINVFAKNLGDLLLAAPAGEHTTMGLDPGIRTGVKVVVVDATGKLIDQTTIYPLQPKNQWDASIATLAQLCQKHGVSLISIGNGTGSRETDRLVLELIKKHDLSLNKIMVSEAGASVYSASKLASDEFPNLDVSLRGAVSIARRLQDPLAELVKIDPKSIGVGQYQHDVNQSRLARSLDNVVEDCVNAVGVDVNTASVPLLARVSGLNETLAKNIVSYRDEHGAYRSREELLKVPRMGAKTYEQAAGFLRIRGGDNPLDASAVHPESYPVVKKILEKNQINIEKIIGNESFLQKISANDYIDDQFGLPTVLDIIKELEKPGRDPRPEFKTAEFQEGIEEIKDLLPDMVLEGVVTNVTNFGAFVDIGVHQDGLVHISEMSNQFIKDPHAVVKSGDVVKVKVMEVDEKRKRISLSMCIGGKTTEKPKPLSSAKPKRKPQQVEPNNSLLGDMLRKAMDKNT